MNNNKIELPDIDLYLYILELGVGNKKFMKTREDNQLSGMLEEIDLQIKRFKKCRERIAKTIAMRRRSNESK